jgi:hypothetical protein
MEGYCSTGQSPQQAVVPSEEEEEEEEEYKVKVKQPHNRSGVAQRVPGGLGSQIS